MNICTTDAIPNTIVKKNNLGIVIIDMPVFEQIEWELEEFEKVAIIFLLSAEYPDSYKTILELCSNINEQPHIISRYVLNSLGTWTSKLEEALCIISNHEVIKNLGYAEPSELCKRYQAHIPRYTVSINEAAKVLYKLFETMDGKTGQLFLDSIYEDGLITKQPHNLQYLELHALYWLQQKFITISAGKADFSNLMKHLKKLDYGTKTIYYDVQHYCTPAVKPVETVGDSSETSLSIKPQLKSVVHNTKEKKDEYRQIKKGLLVIINEVHFARKYKERKGSDKDRDNLKETFRRRNFDVLTRDDLTQEQINEFLESVSENFDETKHDCLIVCILSHGYEGGIVSCDLKQIPIRDIEDRIGTIKLRNVIKMLIVQACQGENIGYPSGRISLPTDCRNERDSAQGESMDDNLRSDGNSEDISRFEHYCRFMSTMDRFVAIRDERHGSWFIIAICEELAKNETISFCDWQINVARNVVARDGKLDMMTPAAQQPVWTTHLGTHVYFPPYVESAK